VQAEHDEMPVLEAQTWIARRREAENRLIPVMNRQDAFGTNRCHRSLETERKLQRGIEGAPASRQLESRTQQLGAGSGAGLLGGRGNIFHFISVVHEQFLHKKCCVKACCAANTRIITRTMAAPARKGSLSTEEEEDSPRSYARNRNRFPFMRLYMRCPGARRSFSRPSSSHHCIPG